jgi:hypothetical protein
MTNTLRVHDTHGLVCAHETTHNAWAPCVAEAPAGVACSTRHDQTHKGTRTHTCSTCTYRNIYCMHRHAPDALLENLVYRSACLVSNLPQSRVVFAMCLIALGLRACMRVRVRACAHGLQVDMQPTCGHVRVHVHACACSCMLGCSGTSACACIHVRVYLHV